MYCYIDDDDPVAVGTLALCVDCHHAIEVRRYVGADTDPFDGETTHWDYRAWEHTAPPPRTFYAGFHDAHPAPGVRERVRDDGCRCITSFGGNCPEHGPR